MDTEERKALFRMSLILMAVTLLAYLPVLRGGGFIWDDDDYVTNNPALRSARGLGEIWASPRASPQYYPLVFSSFWLEWRLWGDSAAEYHLVNVLLHATGAVLLWRVLKRLDVPGCYLAAVIFALHPVNAESAAWVAERKNVLSAVFYFGAAIAYLRSEISDSRPQNSDWRWYGVALGLFVAALLSKTVTCSLPAALLLVIWWKRGRLTGRDVALLVPFFALGLIAAAGTAYLEWDHVDARGPEWDLSIVDRVLIAGRAVWFYAAKLVVPIQLSFIYPRWAIDPKQVVQWAFPITAAIALAVLYAQRDRWGRGPLAGALIYVGTLVPALGFFNIYPMRYSFVADHFQYHASAAGIALIAAGIRRGTAGWKVPGSSAMIGTMVALPLIVLTMVRAHTLADLERLWRDALAKNPDSWMVHLNLAKVLSDREKFDEAEQHIVRQVELAPQLAETHWNLGVHLANRGRFDEALLEYDRALDRDPRLAQAFFGRGNVFRAKGDLQQAEAEYTRAVRLKPDYAEAYYNLGLVLEGQGDPTAAAEAYEKAVAHRPGYARAHNQLGQLMAKAKQVDPAMHHYVQAIEADPDFAQAHLNLAGLLAATGRIDEAKLELEIAVRLDPSMEQYVPRILGTK